MGDFTLKNINKNYSAYTRLAILCHGPREKTNSAPTSS